jgi:hypothetical protein
MDSFIHLTALLKIVTTVTLTSPFKVFSIIRAGPHDEARMLLLRMLLHHKVASTNSDEVSTRTFNFVSMGVYMDLHFNMSNLFSISTACFPYLRKIFSRFCQTSRPKR